MKTWPNIGRTRAIQTSLQLPFKTSQKMNLQLIQGQFMAEDAIGIINQMVHIKIKYHENKISGLSNEEDIKNREAKIKRLQKELYDVRNEILAKKGKIKIESIINID